MEKQYKGEVDNTCEGKHMRGKTFFPVGLNLWPNRYHRASFQTKLENIRLDTAKGYSEGPSLNLRNPSGSSGFFSITSSQVGSNAKFPMLEKSLF